MKRGLKIAAVTALYLVLASGTFAQTAQNPDPSKWMCRNLADSGGFVYQGETLLGSDACRPIPQASAPVQQPQTKPVPAQPQPVVPAQVPMETSALSIKGHTLGESVAAFASARGVTLEQCRLPEKEAKKVLKREYAECKGLLSAAGGSRVTFSSYKNSADLIGAIVRQDFATSFTFDGGKLTKYELSTMKHAYQDVLNDLITRFGRPLTGC